jgi:hypothetical protein
MAYSHLYINGYKWHTKAHTHTEAHRGPFDQQIHLLSSTASPQADRQTGRQAGRQHPHLLPQLPLLRGVLPCSRLRVQLAFRFRDRVGAEKHRINLLLSSAREPSHPVGRRKPTRPTPAQPSTHAPRRHQRSGVRTIAEVSLTNLLSFAIV